MNEILLAYSEEVTVEKCLKKFKKLHYWGLQIPPEKNTENEF